MAIFDFRCACGARFEAVIRNAGTSDPDCPSCGGQSQRLPGLGMIRGLAAAAPGAEGAPTSWEGTLRGDRQYIKHWRGRLEQRRSFEERHPEHTSQRDAIAAHEGAFETSPLTYKELADRAQRTGSVAAARTEAALARITPDARSEP